MRWRFTAACGGTRARSAAVLLALFVVTTPAAAVYTVDLLTGQSFQTLQAAEEAMRAYPNPGAVHLRFERILSETDTQVVRLYSIGSVQPNPHKWSDCANVAGEYDSPQAVCDARRAFINWPRPLTYVETFPDGSLGNGEGQRGACRDFDHFDQPALGYANYLRTCPAGYNHINHVYARTCGFNMPPEGAGPNLMCGNGLTGRISGPPDQCPVPDLKPKPTDACSVALEAGNGIPVPRDDCPATPVLDDPRGEPCLKQKLDVLGIPYTGPTATIRTAAYQAHLRDVWDRFWEHQWLINSPALYEACTAKRAIVEAEMSKHGIDFQPAAVGSGHINGTAFDISRSTVGLMGDVTALLNQAPACNLRWGGRAPLRDRVHFSTPPPAPTP